MMTRNTQRRVEVICPVYATHTKARLNHILDILLRDTVKARALDSEGSYQKKVPAPRAPPASPLRTSSWTRPFELPGGGICRPCPALRSLGRPAAPSPPPRMSPAVRPAPVFCAGFLPAVSLI